MEPKHNAFVLLGVTKDGRPIGSMAPMKRGYNGDFPPSTEVGILSSPWEDLYAIFEDAEDLEGVVNRNEAGAQRVTLRIQVNPLVGWIWYGGLVITVGSLIAIWPSKAGVRPVRSVRTEQPTVGAAD